MNAVAHNGGDLQKGGGGCMGGGRWAVGGCSFGFRLLISMCVCVCVLACQRLIPELICLTPSPCLLLLSLRNLIMRSLCRGVPLIVLAPPTVALAPLPSTPSPPLLPSTWQEFLSQMSSVCTAAFLSLRVCVCAALNCSI